MESNPDDTPPEEYHLGILFAISTGAASTELIFASVAVFVLIICSALISGSEAAFFSLSRKDLEELDEPNGSKSNGNKDSKGKDAARIKANRIEQLLSQPKYLLSTILISNNFINVAIIVVSAYIMKVLFAGNDSKWIVIGINVVLVTFILVLFGEVIPKLYATSRRIDFAKRMAGPLLLLRKLLRPLSLMLVGSTNMIESRLTTLEKNNMSMVDFDKAIDLAVDEDTTEQEVSILKGIVKFGNISVKQIMCSHVDMVSVRVDASFEKLLSLIRDSGYSRIPVFEEDKESIRGIFYAKDLLSFLSGEEENPRWQDKIKEAFFVPEHKKIDDLLKEFQDKASHLAIVVDEYGGTMGLVTLEDIMEEIIGEIEDEFDDQESRDFRKLDDHNYIFRGRTLINDVCRRIGLNSDAFDELRGESDTLAGLVLEMKGQFPSINEQLEHENYRFTVIETSRAKIEKVKITLLEVRRENSVA